MVLLSSAARGTRNTAVLLTEGNEELDFRPFVEHGCHSREVEMVIAGAGSLEMSGWRTRKDKLRKGRVGLNWL